jgi:chemotaxis protein methyltransferase CheR
MIAALAKVKFGLDLQPSKKPLVYSRLAKRLRALSLPTFEKYCTLLDRPEGESEKSHLLSALTTNVTHFFREAHHFDFLRDKIAPALIAKAKAGKSVRLWSSACSAGQEAYSIAAALNAADPEVGRYDIRILATDIDPLMITKAKEGAYNKEQLAAIPAPYLKIMVCPNPNETTFLMSPQLRQMISFAELNLIESWPMKRKLDVIFCRNAAIYFDKATQSKLWQSFAAVMEPGGHLMIGHSERLSGPAASMFRSVGITTYQKQPQSGTSRLEQE